MDDNGIFRRNPELTRQFVHQLYEQKGVPAMSRKMRNLPKWAGSPTFAEAARGCDEALIVEWANTDESDPSRFTENDLFSPAGLVHWWGLKLLERARPVVIDSDQLLALPEFESEIEMWQMLAESPMPLKTMYLDFGRRLAFGITVNTSDDKIEHSGVLLGAIVHLNDHHDADDNMALLRESLTIIPVCHLNDAPWVESPGLALVARNPDAPDMPSTRTRLKTQGVVGAVMYGAGVAATKNEHGEHRTLGEAEAPTTRATIIPAVGVEFREALTRTHKYEEDLPSEVANQPEVRAMIHEERLRLLLASATTMLAARALYFLTAHNVEVVEKPMIKRERKRAEKRGWPIASTITVRRTLRRTGQQGNGGGAREYSHQFEVTGRYNHVTKGSHVRCRKCAGEGGLNVKHGDDTITWTTCEKCKGSRLDPELVKPCSRRDQHGNPTCPDGCRREWVPSHWKGPEDAIAVPKIRKVA